MAIYLGLKRDVFIALVVVEHTSLWTQELEARVACLQPPFDVRPAFTCLTDVMLTGSDDIYPCPTEYAFFGACCRFPAGAKTLYRHRLRAEEGVQKLSWSDGRDRCYSMQAFSKTNSHAVGLEGPYKPILVVCSASALSVWKEEISKFPEMGRQALLQMHALFPIS